MKCYFRIFRDHLLYFYKHVASSISTSFISFPFSLWDCEMIFVRRAQKSRQFIVNTYFCLTVVVALVLFLLRLVPTKFFTDGCWLKSPCGKVKFFQDISAKICTLPKIMATYRHDHFSLNKQCSETAKGDFFLWVILLRWTQSSLGH